ncbi:MAG: phage portal protein [Ruminococcus sp.]|nr:phage portal protein [Ruminococcus sp.]
MGIFKRKIKNEAETLTIQQINDFFDSQDVLSAMGKSDLTAATYYACMQIRCSALAKIPFKLYRQDGDGAQSADHSISELLKFRPNPYTTAHDFLWATEFQRLEYGNAFWVYNFSGGKITALYLLNSPAVEIMVDNAGILDKPNGVYYIYTDEKKGRLIYPADRVVHFKNFSMNGIKGTPLKKYLYDVIMQEKYAQKVVKEKYSKGLQDPIVVFYTGDLNREKSQAIKKKFASLGGAENAGKVVPLQAGFEVKQLETKLVNSQFFELNGLTTRHIANAFGVKSFQLNDMEKSTYSNIEQQNRAFYSDTMQNVLTCYEQEMTYKLLSTADRKSGIFVKGNADVFLRSDIESRYRSYQIGILSGFLKISEARKKEDLPFVPGTDKLIIGNGASIPLEDLGKQYEKGGANNE